MTNPIPFETRFEDIRVNVVDIADFNERVVGAYNSGLAEKGLPADDQTARSVIPAGTGALRDAVRDVLRASSYVAKMRPGEPGEGGDGVTVVWLRW